MSPVHCTLVRLRLLETFITGNVKLNCGFCSRATDKIIELYGKKSNLMDW